MVLRWIIRALCVPWVMFPAFASIDDRANHQAGAPDISADSPVTVALTRDIIAVDVSFSGASFMLFGVIANRAASITDIDAIDIIATISGPPRSIRARPVQRTGPIFIPGEAHFAENVPGLYFIISSRAIDLITDDATRARLHFDLDRLPIALTPADRSTPAQTVRTAIRDAAQKRGLFRTFTGTVDQLGNGLFSMPIDLPAQTPVGDYKITVTAWHNGQLIGADRAALSVSKAGIERQIYELAHGYPFFYGILCVLISLFAGWVVSIAFRKA